MSTTRDDANRGFLEDALRTLGTIPRSVPSKYLYDEHGSQLFEQICQLDEYYLTRTEAVILRDCADEVAERMGEGCLLIEYGSGSSTKTRILLDRAPALAAYVPIDISREFLMQSAESLSARYPSLDVRPVCADYTGDYELPKLDPAESRRVVWFPGSTIGNLTPGEATAFLAHVTVVAGHGGGLLIGVDLHKDARTLEAAYDDAQGVSAEFALNLLDRMNRELGADFRREDFGYHAAYDEREKRIEMAIVSRSDQRVRIDGREFALAAGERIRTEYSYKYTLEGFAELARGAGLDVERVWTDSESLFSVQYLVVA
ncbi:MAG: L-histidine N(alpha)-methyltransferase [Deltaproteobacteria bacterium]|nr:L-histidine N(alpha)-methyltransferase [Deltaproteobacteria bacterium]MBW2414629.1 L-histidine N(alpha)-methyltransferase [Deltaproteobacteria bacterium]